MNNRQRQFLTPIAFSSIFLEEDSCIAIACLTKFKGAAWVIQTADEIKPENLVVINALTGEPFQVLDDKYDVVVGDISEQQLKKIDKMIESRASKVMESMLGASVTFTDFISKKYPEYYQHMKDQCERRSTTES